jgi:hypothetical protein
VVRRQTNPSRRQISDPVRSRIPPSDRGPRRADRAVRRDRPHREVLAAVRQLLEAPLLQPLGDHGAAAKAGADAQVWFFWGGGERVGLGVWFGAGVGLSGVRFFMCAGWALPTAR